MLKRIIIKKIRLKAIFFLLMAIIFFPEFSFAQGNAYEFLNIPSSSYVFGSGGVNISSLHTDIDLASQNPSLIGPENDMQLKLGYMYYYGSSNFGSARFAKGVGEHGAWAAGVRYLNYGNFAGYDEEGTATGNFTAQDIVAEGTFSYDINYRLRGGINVKMIYSAYEQYNAFAMAADLGISYYDDDHDFAFGAVLKNMGGQLKRFEDRYNRLPFDIQLGITKGIGKSFSLSVTALHLTKWKLPFYTYIDGEETGILHSGFFRNLFRHLVFGLDFEPNERFYLTLGYNYKTYTDQSSYSRNLLSGFSIGGGFNVKSFSVGVAYAYPHKGASTLLLNLGLDINDLIK